MAALPATYHKVQVTKLSTDFRAAAKVVESQTSELVKALTENKVLIKYEYLGINASDVNFTAGRYDPRMKPPFDAGFEGIGKVVAVGPNVRRLKAGDAVATMSYGAFSEYQVLPETSVIPVAASRPEILSLLVSGLTASIALEQSGRIAPKETVLVTAAAGGAGQIAIQIAKIKGCHVIGTCSSPEKAEFLKSLGCDRVINYKTEKMDQVLKKEYPKGIDVVFESVGGAMFDTALKCLAVKGRLIVIGAMASYKASEKTGSFSEVWTDAAPTVSLLQKSTTVVGFFLNHYTKEFARHLTEMTQLVLQGKLKPLVDLRGAGIQSVFDAVDYLQSGKNIGKVVVPLVSAEARL